MASNSTMIHKLQQALNMNGHRILQTTSQFYSVEQERPITIYHLKEAVYDEDKNKFINLELFSSTSQIQILLFLRDMWYEHNGWEVPKDNEVWNNKKQNIK